MDVEEAREQDEAQVQWRGAHHLDCLSTSPTTAGGEHEAHFGGGVCQPNRRKRRFVSVTGMESKSVRDLKKNEYCAKIKISGEGVNENEIII